jgi:hypothetical protein
MLVELGLVEQRLKAVHEVLDGATVTDVAMRNGVHPPDGAHLAPSVCELGGGRPGRQDLEARELSAPDESGRRGPDPRDAPDPSRVDTEEHSHPSGKESVTPLPGRSSIYRALVRHQLLEPIVGRFYLADGTEVKDQLTLEARPERLGSAVVEARGYPTGRRCRCR